jgi:multiple sugar transport system permease protein
VIDARLAQKPPLPLSPERLRRFLWHALIYFVLLFVALVSFFPFFTMLISSTHDAFHITSTVNLLPGDQFMRNYERMQQNKDIWKGFANSFFLACASMVLCLYFSSMTAYGFSKFSFKGKGTLFTVIMVTMMIPGQLGVIGFFREMQAIKMTGTYWPLVIPSIANCFAVFFFKQYLDGGLPNELIEAALMDGCRELPLFHRIVLPCMLPALVTQGVMSFIGSWNSYLMPLLILNKGSMLTLPVLLASVKTSAGTADYGAQYVGILISVAPLLVIFLLANKVIMEKIAIGAAIKG